MFGAGIGSLILLVLGLGPPPAKYRLNRGSPVILVTSGLRLLFGCRPSQSESSALHRRLPDRFTVAMILPGFVVPVSYLLVISRFKGLRTCIVTRMRLLARACPIVPLPPPSLPRSSRVDNCRCIEIGGRPPSPKYKTVAT